MEELRWGRVYFSLHFLCKLQGIGSTTWCWELFVDGAPSKVVTCSILFGASSSSLYFHLITVPSSLEPDFSIETNKSAYLDTGDVDEGNQF